LPLQKIFKGINYKIGVWEFNEHEFNLNHCKIIHPNYHKDFIDYKNESRKWQIYGVKLLFNELIDNEILISKNGIPYIEQSNKEISITHTKNTIAIIIADFPCGIDIEQNNRNTLKIKHKFTNNEDFNDGNDLKELLKKWCIKEVLYKSKRDNSVLFNNHLIVKKSSDGYKGFCRHPNFSFSSNIKVSNFQNYFLAFNTDYTLIND
jgi:hypothetical protein